MDKKVLKDVLAGLTAGQEIEVNFRGDKANLSGRFAVVESKIDRGKMGSRKATLRPASSDPQDVTNLVVLHTKFNNEVLNISVDGNVRGSANESDEPREYAKDAVRSKELTETFKNFAKDSKVELTSDVEPSFNGTFTVKDNKASRGKFGQRVLTLVNVSNNQPLEVWSYRHSTVIKTITQVQ